ncbi:MAG: TIGR03619 family F420-dependent LLM class oxidoreductase [Deltaproteobacteria bacterium]|nr:TIGR03619 family F420-dependent LLM class oxidoreductase [Deltaproteobacteria bacterium]
MQIFQVLSRTPTRELPELAALAERLGFDGIGLSDHLVRPREVASRYPYSADGRMEAGTSTPYPDPFVAIAALSQVTTRVRFLTNVYVLPLRDPFTVAKAVSTAAVFAGDRVVFGVGVGWMAEEFALTGQRFEARGRRTDEMLEVVAKLLSGEMVEHHGEFYDFAPLQMQPVPSRRPPVWVGGESAVAMRRAARCDGWLGIYYDEAGALERIEQVQRARREAGRANEAFEIALALREAPDAAARRRLEGAGMTVLLHPAPWPADPGGIGLAERRAALERAAERLIA